MESFERGFGLGDAGFKGMELRADKAHSAGCKSEEDCRDSRGKRPFLTADIAAAFCLWIFMAIFNKWIIEPSPVTV